MQAVVLAGGLATRMRPRTLTIPKAMLEVAGRPFIEWQLEKLAACGYDEVVMCIAHLGEQIRDHVGNGARFGLRVRYSVEGPKLLGTGGALRAALERLAPTFLLTYGDSYLPFDYAGPLRMLDAHDDCDAVMSVWHNKDALEPSNVVCDGEWVTTYEKGGRGPGFEYIDYGANAVRRELVAQKPEGEAWGFDALQRDLARSRRLRAYVSNDRFFEIGSPEGLAALNGYLSP